MMHRPNWTWAAGYPSINPSYFKAKGALKEMSEPDWSAIGNRLLINTLWSVAAPIGAIYMLFHFGNETVGWSLLVTYLLLISIFFAVKLARWLLRGFRKLRRVPDDRLKPFLLWDKMYAVWRSLEGPVVNPSMVREEMMKSRDEGAVWPVPAWALIERVIQIDPAVWVTQPNR